MSDYQQMLADIEQRQIEETEKAERQQAEMVGRVNAIRQTIRDVENGKPTGDVLTDAQLRANGAAVVTELNNELRRLASEREQLRIRNELIQFNLRKKADFLKSQLELA